MDEGCLDNSLTVLDDTPEHQNSSLKYPGLSAKCGQSTLPYSGQSVISTGTITIRFHSLINNQGNVRFKIRLEATAPEFCPLNTVDDECPFGPCCQGENCCIYHVGTIAKGTMH